MKYFLIAGEASGDLHASNLMKVLLRHDHQAEFRFMGGDLMGACSGGMVMHYRETSYMMLDVLFHLRKIFRNMRRLKSEIRTWQPDVLIPVDYPGFNLRMARFANSIGIRVFYYISPKVWAWRQKRIEQLRKYTSRLFVILPFEVKFFHGFGMEVEYFGNPLVDSVRDFRNGFVGVDQWKEKTGLDQRPVVALLAGSRRKEIEAMLPVMVNVAQEHTGYQFVVAGAPSIEPSLYDRYLDGSGIGIVYGETYALLESAFAGMVTSGTATLEAALFNVPQVVLYRTGSMAYAIAKRLIKINFISLVNLIRGTQLVAEIIQLKMGQRAGGELARILGDREYRDSMKSGYAEIRKELGEPGVTERVGRQMMELLKVDSE
ncbi:MAG: lipid-A-disaccharide synthase [Bacteroidales bacterium]|nr:lipid-A-disaccharide synthase [Bacteroidales bacterium]